MRWIVLACILLGAASASETALAAPGSFSDVTKVTATGSVNPGQVARGGMVALNAKFSSSAPIDAVNLSLEVHEATGALAFRQLYEAQRLPAGQARSFSVRWAVPTTLPPGNYILQLAAFSTDYSVSYGWNETAGSLVIANDFGGLVPGTYYLDCATGSDTNDGTQPAHAWASLARLNAAVLQPGDTVKLKRGCVWTGELDAIWNGGPDHPVTFTAYGTGDLPSIQNGDFAEIRVTGSYLVFDNLEVRADPLTLDTACNNNPIGRRIGIYLDKGSTHNVVQNSVAEDNSIGVAIGQGSSNNAIEHNEVRNNNMMNSLDPYEDDGGGHGILIQGDTNDVSYNHVSGSYACSTRYERDGDAIEVFGATNNRVHHNRMDGNYIFAELSQSFNTEFAYNVSTDGGFTNHGDALGTKLYNNVFYVPGGAGIVGCTPCAPGAVELVNNIFVAVSVIYADGGVTENHNIYWSPTIKPYLSVPMDSTSKVVNPQLVDPANGDFGLLPNSPAVGAGSSVSVEHGYTVDANGATVLPGGPVDIGAFQVSGSASAGDAEPGSR